MFLEWTPSRHLIGTGSNGKIEPTMISYDRLNKSIMKEARSLDGSTETVLHRIDVIYNIGIAPTRGTVTRDKMREFAASVAAGESFVLDALGTEAAPVDAVTVSMAPNSYRETYLGDSIFSYSFKVRL